VYKQAEHDTALRFSLTMVTASRAGLTAIVRSPA
jgi:hypothetical protein